MPLSDTACRGAKPGPKPRKMFDGGGLYLYVKPTGSRLWQMAYRYEGKAKTLSFGAYPEVTLADARARRLEAKALLAKGVDPSTRRERGGFKPAGDSFEEIAREWHGRHYRTGNRKYAESVLSMLARDAFPEIGRMRIGDIEAPVVLAVLRKVEARGSHDVVRRLLWSVQRVFGYAIATGRAVRNPAAGLHAALDAKPKTTPMARVPKEELPQLIDAIRRYDGKEQTRVAIELVLHTAVRTKELLEGRWSEIRNDLWRIPGGRMKMGREHLVPLTPQALGLLARLRELGNGSLAAAVSVRRSCGFQHTSPSTRRGMRGASLGSTRLRNVLGDMRERRRRTRAQRQAEKTDRLGDQLAA